MNEARAISVHRFLVRMAFAGVLFVWVAGFAHLSWITGDAHIGFIVTLLAYSCAHLVIFFGAPLCARHVREGVRRTLVLGTLLLAIGLAYGGTAFGAVHTFAMTTWSLFVFAFVWGLYRALYTVPYTAHTQSTHTQSVWREVVLALMPCIYVIVALYGGFAWLCGIASVFALLSLIPLSRLTEEYESYRWTPTETIMQIFLPHNRPLVAHAMARGVERMVLFLVWPLMILMFSSSLLMFGALLSLTLFLTLAFRSTMVNFFNYGGIDRSPVVASVSVFSLWLIRGLVATPLGILVAHVSSALLPHTHTPDPDGRVYVDEYAVVGEMGSALGVVMGCVVVIALALTMPLVYVLFWSCVGAGLSSVYAHWTSRSIEPRL